MEDKKERQDKKDRWQGNYGHKSATGKPPHENDIPEGFDDLNLSNGGQQNSVRPSLDETDMED